MHEIVALRDVILKGYFRSDHSTSMTKKVKKGDVFCGEISRNLVNNEVILTYKDDPHIHTILEYKQADFLATSCDNWKVYLLRCADSSLYIGITKELKKRLKAHNSGKGAKYTSGRSPSILLAYIETEDKSEALKFEYKFKKLPQEKKLKCFGVLESEIGN